MKGVDTHRDTSAANTRSTYILTERPSAAAFLVTPRCVSGLSRTVSFTVRCFFLAMRPLWWHREVMSRKEINPGDQVSWPDAFRPTREDMRHFGHVEKITDTSSGEMVWIVGKPMGIPAARVRVERSVLA